MTVTSTTTAPAPATNGQPQAAPATAPAPRPSLDDYLREFDPAAATARPAAAAPATAAPAPQPAAASPAPAPAAQTVDPDRIARLEQRLDNRDTETEINRTVETVRNSSEFLQGVDPDIVYGHLQALGARDPRFRVAFMQRNQKPDVWANLLKSVGAQLEEKLKPLAQAPSATARASVIAAARVSGRAPTTPDVDSAKVRQMGDQEFNRYKRGLRAGAR